MVSKVNFLSPPKQKFKPNGRKMKRIQSSISSYLKELESAAFDLGIQARRIGRVFDVRWLSSSCTSVTALWESYPAFPARRFAEMWLKQGHHAAIDPPTGKQKKEAEVRHQSGLFS